MGNIFGQAQQQEAAEGVGNWNETWNNIQNGFMNWWQIILGVVVFFIVISGLYFLINTTEEEEDAKLNFTETKPDRNAIFLGTANAATLAYSLYRLTKMLF